ncbi:hypothetical protein GA0115240_16414 [Streptomyces sp. DvalAA-14]|uniref:hypothetical protein n=1 Tax=unclassified Streptomyces TaxID=2593676 RepID=UPI00081BA84A|nr:MULTISPECIES: hypothetical protein [unclassified Streptomyces]MYS24447.1 hypothetical protein [Streptomyces sp. SID4948]SCE46134.1 hypothetical protein GA0115240_16414 [Streptomyces sp. DvalAA-14]
MTTQTAAAAAAEQTALVEEATKKSGLVWVNGQPVWHAWVDGALCLVAGPGEQPLPPALADGAAATVTVRSKDKGGRLVTWPARAALLDPASDAWRGAAAELKSKRLNSPDGEGVTERWARECGLFRLAPDGPPSEHPGAMPAASGAAPPLPTGATTRQPIPAGLPRLVARRRKKK